MPREAADSSSMSGKKLFEPQQSEQVPGVPFQTAVYQVRQASCVGLQQLQADRLVRCLGWAWQPCELQRLEDVGESNIHCGMLVLGS
jgi:hypothetical protein